MGDFLWHYTGFSGLHGIVERREIWASDLRYLNDTTEFNYTLDAFNSAARAAIEHCSEAAFPLTYERLKFSTTSSAEWSERLAIYTACFSRARDDLSQWRAYAGQPPGFALGFDPVALEQVASKIDFALVECSYDASVLKHELQALVDRWAAELQQHEHIYRKLISEAPTALFGITQSAELTYRVLVLAQASKHPSFAAEREIRLVGSLGTPLEDGWLSGERYRQSGTLVVPYRGITLAAPNSPLPIREVLVGPCPHQDAVIRAVQRFVTQHEVQAEVRASRIPFRNW